MKRAPMLLAKITLLIPYPRRERISLIVPVMILNSNIKGEYWITSRLSLRQVKIKDD